MGFDMIMNPIIKLGGYSLHIIPVEGNSLYDLQ